MNDTEKTFGKFILLWSGDFISAVGLVFVLVSLLQGEAQLWQVCVGVIISFVFASFLELTYWETQENLDLAN